MQVRMCSVATNDVYSMRIVHMGSLLVYVNCAACTQKVVYLHTL